MKSILFTFLALTLLSAFNPLVAAPPPNDQCSGAVIISSGASTFNVTLSTLEATSTGDPSSSCFSVLTSLGNGVWYQFTPPLNGVITVTTVGSDFDTGLAIFTGACGSTVELACNDDFGGGTNRTSQIVGLTVHAGTTYRILVGGYNGAKGNLSFHLTFTSDDQCAGATVIPVSPGQNMSYQSRQSTLSATSTSDPGASCVTGFGNGVWYQFTPIQDGQITVITAGSDFDTGLAIYTGSCGSLTQIACNDDVGAPTNRTSRILNLPVAANTTYRILAGGYNAAHGNLSFRLDFSASGEVPWVALEDLTGADYQTNFTRWTSAPYGLRLTCVTAYDSGSGPRYTGLWAKEPGPGYYAGAGMTAAQFTSSDTSYRAQGFQPTFISGFTSGGVHYYNAIWTYLPQVNSLVLLDMSAGTLAGQIIGKTGAGYALDYVTAFTDSSSDVYAAIFIQGASPSQCTFGRTAAQHQSDFVSLTAQGYRLVAESTAMSGTTPLYSAVFRPPFGQAWYSYPGVSMANYKGETLNAYYTGFRPTFVSTYTNNNTTACNAVWTLNGGPDPAAMQPIYNTINDYITSNSVPGMTLAIARNGRLVFAKGFGLADQAANAWVHPDNRFRIASVSKPITVTGVLRLRDGVGGTLGSLDLTVFGGGALLGTTYGTQGYNSWELGISVRHLLSHTSGWTDDGKLWYDGYDHTAILDWQLDNDDPTHAPGSFYQYQNIDYCTAGRVIEKLSGMSYEQYIKNQVLAPCGITDMELGYQLLANRLPNEVVYYPDAKGDPYVAIDPHRMDANGGWIGRPIDLLLLMRRIDGTAINTDIISSARFNDMQSGNATSAAKGYGLGTVLNGSWFGHNGDMAGTGAMLIHRTDGFDFAFIGNKNTMPVDEYSWKLKGYMDAAINAVPLSAWPNYDLFNSVNTNYDSWSAATFPDYLRAQPGMKADFWGPEADPDGDGIANLMEAYFQYDPFSPSSLPFVALVENGDFVVRWTRSLLSSLNGVQLKAQVKTDLAPAIWYDGPPIQSHLIGGSLNLIYETRFPLSASATLFQRFQATAP